MPDTPALKPSRPSPSREAILAAFWRLAGRKGARRVKMDEVRRTAAVSRATLYRHFPGKDSLVARAWLEKLPEWFQQEAQTPAKPGGPALQALRRIFKTYLKASGGIKLMPVFNEINMSGHWNPIFREFAKAGWDMQTREGAELIRSDQSRGRLAYRGDPLRTMEILYWTAVGPQVCQYSLGRRKGLVGNCWTVARFLLTSLEKGAVLGRPVPTAKEAFSPHRLPDRYFLCLARLCQRQSLYRLSVEKVRRSAGTSRGAFYHHFRNWRDLVGKCLEGLDRAAEARTIGRRGAPLEAAAHYVLFPSSLPPAETWGTFLADLHYHAQYQADYRAILTSRDLRLHRKLTSFLGVHRPAGRGPHPSLVARVLLDLYAGCLACQYSYLMDGTQEGGAQALGLCLSHVRSSWGLPSAGPV